MKTKVAQLALGALVSALLTAKATPVQATPAPDKATASQRHVRAKHHRRVAAQTPPPIRSAQPAGTQASAATPAPVPNESVTAPNDPGAPNANVAPSVFALHYPPQGDGYVTGSSPQAMDDRNAARATGVQMKMPLPQ